MSESEQDTLQLNFGTVGWTSYLTHLTILVTSIGKASQKNKLTVMTSNVGNLVWLLLHTWVAVKYYTCFKKTLVKAIAFLLAWL